MKKPILFIISALLLISVSACSGSGHDTSTLTYEEISKMEQQLPDPDEYPTESELNHYALNYRLSLDISEGNGLCKHVVERFESTASVYEDNSEYDEIKSIYKKACKKIGKVENITKKDMKELSEYLNQTATLDAENNINLSYSFVKPDEIFNVYLTYSPFNNKGEMIRSEKGSDESETIEISSPFKTSETRRKFETYWTQYEVAEPRLTIAVIETSEKRYVFK